MRKQLTMEDYRNWWLQKYHNTNCEEVLKNYPEESKSIEWYKIFAVTQEQHDEWYEWALNTLAKERRVSKKLARRMFSLPYLDAAPSIIQKQPSDDNQHGI